MSEKVAAIRSLVRPVVTIGVVAAFALAAFVNREAAETLKEITLVLVSFWFGQRIAGQDGGGS